MTNSFDEVMGAYNADSAAPAQSDQLQPDQQEQSRPWFDVGDILAAVPRGIVGAAKSAYNLADTLTGDPFGHWQNNPLGESKSVIGGLVEGASSFAAGFIPIAGWLGKAGAVGEAAGLVNAGAEATGLLGGAARLTTLGKAAAGVATDFTVWEGHQKRLSNLIQEYPALQNPVSEFLASDPTDSEVGGRLKGALEGLGLGAVTHAVFLGVKSLGIFNKAVAAGKTVEEAAAEAEKEVPTQEIADAYTKDVSIPPGSTTQTGPSEGSAPPPEPPPAASGNSTDNAFKFLGGSADDAVKFADAVAGRVHATEEYGLSGRVNPRTLSPFEIADRQLEDAKINLANAQGPDTAIEATRAASQLYKAVLDAHPDTLGTQDTQRVLRESLSFLGDLTGVPEDQIHAKFSAGSQALQDLIPLAKGAQAVYTWSGQRTAQQAMLVKSILSGAEKGNVDGALVKFQQYMAFHIQHEMDTRALLGGSGQLLRSLGMKTPFMPSMDFADAFAHDPEALAKSVETGGGREALSKMADQVIAAYGDGADKGTAAVTKLFDAPFLSKTMAVTQEYWMNALFGAKTPVTIGLGTLLHSIYKPIESILGGAIGTATRQALGEPNRAAQHYAAMKNTIGELLNLAPAVGDTWKVAKAMRFLGDSRFDPNATAVDSYAANRAIQARTFGADPQSAAGHAIDFMGGLINLPSKLITTVDSLTKSLNYFSQARSRLAEQAIAELPDVADHPKFIADGIDKLVYDGQTYSAQQLYRRGTALAVSSGTTDLDAIKSAAEAHVKQAVDSGEFARYSALSKDALDYGRVANFTAPQEEGTFARGLQSLINAHPFLRFIAPFVNTPTNLGRFAAQRMDVPAYVRALTAVSFPDTAASLKGTHNQFLRDMLQGDARTQNNAIGRAAAGSSLIVTMGALAHRGLITGRGPSDPDQRKALLDSGWLPYAVKTDTGYLSYARMEPFASLIGTAADVMDYSRYAMPEDQGKVSTAATGLLVALANNLTNKSYLTGIANIIEGLSAPDKKLNTMISRYAASAVPNLYGGQDVVAAGDDNMRDVRGILDAMVNKLPGLSSTLPPQRNVIGEPIKRVEAAGSSLTGGLADAVIPFAYRETSDDIVKHELATLGHAFMPPRRVANGMDLSDQKNSTGQTAYDRYGELQGTVRLDGMTLRDALRKTIKDPGYQRLSNVTSADLDSPRVSAINRVIQLYRAAAWRQVLQEYPAVSDHEKAVLQGRRQLAAGIDPRLLSTSFQR